jgi:hypothetical protein
VTVAMGKVEQPVGDGLHLSIRMNGIESHSNVGLFSSVARCN